MPKGNDANAAEALERLHADLKQRGIELKFARANRPLRERLTRIGSGGHLGEQNLFPSVHAAVAAFRGQSSADNPAKSESPGDTRKINA